MKTEIIDIKSGDYRAGIDRAGEILRQGGIVAIPTETVYGLAASAFDDEAIKKVFLAKGRPQNNPLIVHINNIDMLYKVAKDIPDKAMVLAEKFWPGPLTMVLTKKDAVAKSVSAGLDTVAVRMPSLEAARDIIRASGIPLAAPSANISGQPSPTTAKHVTSDLNGKVDAIVSGDDCTVGVESTVVALFCSPPRLLRPGAVTAEQLRDILPDLIIDKAVLTEPAPDEEVSSPGMLYKHYSPKTEAFLVEDEKGEFANFVNLKAEAAAICFEDELDKIKIPKISYGTNSDKSTLAKNLFSALRQVDTLCMQKVYIHAPDKGGIGLAVYNRLIRAAGFKVIKL